MSSRANLTRATTLAALTTLFYAIYVLVELTLAAMPETGAAWGSILPIFGIVIAPAVGLVALVRVSPDGVALVTAGMLLLTCLIGGALAFYGLHIAPPDPLNGVILAMTALVHFLLLLILAGVVSFFRWRSRRQPPLKGPKNDL